MSEFTIAQLFLRASEILSMTLGLLTMVAFVVFIWGVTQYVIAKGDEKKLEEGKRVMIYGIIGLAIIISIWGIVELLVFTIFGETAIGNPFDFAIPQFDIASPSGSPPTSPSLGGSIPSSGSVDSASAPPLCKSNPLAAGCEDYIPPQCIGNPYVPECADYVNPPSSYTVVGVSAELEQSIKAQGGQCINGRVQYKDEFDDLRSVSCQLQW